MLDRAGRKKFPSAAHAVLVYLCLLLSVSVLSWFSQASRSLSVTCHASLSPILCEEFQLLMVQHLLFMSLHSPKGICSELSAAGTWSCMVHGQEFCSLRISELMRVGRVVEQYYK